MGTFDSLFSAAGSEIGTQVGRAAGALAASKLPLPTPGADALAAERAANPAPSGVLTSAPVGLGSPSAWAGPGGLAGVETERQLARREIEIASRHAGVETWRELLERSLEDRNKAIHAASLKLERERQTFELAQSGLPTLLKILGAAAAALGVGYLVWGRNGPSRRPAAGSGGQRSYRRRTQRRPPTN